MPIRVVVAGASGWAGSAVARAVAGTDDMVLVGAISRRHDGEDVGRMLGLEPLGVSARATVEAALAVPADVLVDYTHPTAVRHHVMTALARGVNVVVGTSGLSGDDYREIAQAAADAGRGVIAAGNFSLTAALAKHFALMAARYLPSWEIVEYASADKVDAPSGTVRELAEALEAVGHPVTEVPIAETLGVPATRGGEIGGTRVHAVRLPGWVLAFDAAFGQADERLIIRHEAGPHAGPYVAGTLLAIRAVVGRVGLTRGLDRLLFDREADTPPP
jgi:4-hydroxy-tetrahydrodipicolinate reductase